MGVEEGKLPVYMKVLGHGGIAMSKVDGMIKWLECHSIWPLTKGLACCALEMMAAGMPKVWCRILLGAL